MLVLAHRGTGHCMVTLVNVLDAAHVGNGPVAQAALPYWLLLCFHGNRTLC